MAVRASRCRRDITATKSAASHSMAVTGREWCPLKSMSHSRMTVTASWDAGSQLAASPALSALPGMPSRSIRRFISAAAMGLFEYLARKRGMTWLDNFSMAGSMLVGMAAAVALFAVV